MNTIPDTFPLRNRCGGQGGRRLGFRVPFGLKDGRAWAPGEVEKGKACGCTCPGCGAPLAAKAQESRRKRPHFAHLVDAECQTGRETGIHLRAKQLIAERRRLTTPAWGGDLFDLPNPPQARDDEGRIHWGREVVLRARCVDLRNVELERSLGAYQPDVYAHDDMGELLIEIRVTHAVDDRKAERVQVQGQRMVEIDLSTMPRDTPHDVVAFEQAVLFEVTNRTWISCPEAVHDWQAYKRELDQQVAVRNEEIALYRAQQLQAAEARRVREAQQSNDKASRKAHMRQVLRAKHANDLAALVELTAPERIAHLQRESQIEAEERVGELLNVVPAAVRSACLRAHEHAWVFGVDPVLWQLLAYDHFVAKQAPGYRFNQRDVATWVRRSFHPERSLYRLFVAQYANRADVRRAGYSKRRLSHWAFTEEENARIPDFYAPINDFMDRLESARLIHFLPAPIGECEVLPPPAAGWHPVAYIAPGNIPSGH